MTGTISASRFEPFLKRYLDVWTQRSDLVALVEQSTASVDWFQPGPNGRLGRTKTLRGQTMLTILTYCYAIGFYSSREIELQLVRKRATGAWLDQMPLDARAFREFRRYNRDLIKQCLKRVLREIFQLRSSRSSPRAAGPKADNEQPPQDSLTVGFEYQLACEAERRIHQAIEIDSMEMDY